MTTITTTHLTPDQSVADWVTADFHLAAVFEKYGIDYCCGGQKPVGEACAEHTVSPDTILQEVVQVNATPGSTERYDQWALDFLADYIVNQFHLYTKDMLPKLSESIEAVQANNHFVRDALR